jgi:hypothetical protein
MTLFFGDSGAHAYGCDKRFAIMGMHQTKMRTSQLFRQQRGRHIAPVGIAPKMGYVSGELSTDS